MSIDHFYASNTLKNPVPLGIAAIVLIGLVTIFLSMELTLNLIIAAGFSKELAVLNSPMNQTEPSKTFALIGAAALLVTAGKILSLLLGTILYLCWVYRTASNAENLTSSGMTFTPGASVGWHFVPVVNLWRIPRAINEIWAASQRLTGVTSTLVSVWFSCWILGNVAANIASKMTDNGDPQVVMFGCLVDALARAILIASGIALILLIRQINNFQILLAQNPPSGAGK
jgi:hypothetical protein